MRAMADLSVRVGLAVGEEGGGSLVCQRWDAGVCYNGCSALSASAGLELSQMR
jgi:hypothetical protein